MGKREKRPKIAATPPPRGARFGADPAGTNDRKPVWSIALFDAEEPWGRERCRADDSLWSDVFPKLRDYESMTWGEILREKTRNHSVGVADIIKPARDRLAALRLDDLDELFRLRLTGTQRVWGIRDREILRLLWWDPDHEVCPSALKNT